MSLVVPNVGTARILNILAKLNIGPETCIRLFTNDRIPTVNDSAANYNQPLGGGYVRQSLSAANWILSTSNPSQIIYNDFVEFNFTGPIGGTNIYGYMFWNPQIFDPLVLAERFPDDEVPFVPVNGATIRVKPSITLAYQEFP